MRVSQYEAERIESDGYRTIIVPAGTEVTVGRGWIATVTRDSLVCDCGKGVACNMNPLRRMGT